MRKGHNGFHQIAKHGEQGYANLGPNGDIIKGTFFKIYGMVDGGVYITEDLYNQLMGKKPNDSYREGGPVDLDYYWVTPINFETKTGGNPLIDPGYYHPYVSFSGCIKVPKRK
jgi:hypothetical protein